MTKDDLRSTPCYYNGTKTQCSPRRHGTYETRVVAIPESQVEVLGVGDDCTILTIRVTEFDSNELTVGVGDKTSFQSDR